ncbi:MAG TPA: sigma-70 family RNA polymerase sigma factor [Candidatus Acidoferrum sp.]|nr:sigma-70 family RNA polymerase sigma factor [Candidatus Acidoferrum sp.]
MKSPRARSGSGTFFLSSVDRLGRAIDPLILAIAHEIGPRAVRYAERLLGDQALALDLLEESAAAVSEALKRKTTGDSGKVRNMERYLFRTYLRKVSLVRGKQTRLDKSLRAKAPKQPARTEFAEAEIALLFDEVMATYDKVTRQIVYRRLEGYSWKEIGTEFGITTHAAEARYSRALAQARKVLAKRQTPD